MDEFIMVNTMDARHNTEPVTAQRTIRGSNRGRGDDPPGRRIHAGQVRHDERARNEERQAANAPVQKAGDAADRNGGDVRHPEDIEQEECNQIPGAKNRGQKVRKSSF